MGNQETIRPRIEQLIKGKVNFLETIDQSRLMSTE